MSSSPLSNGKQMSDNQSWNSSGSEEDLETDPGPHGGGVAEFSGVLSKVKPTQLHRVFTARLELKSHQYARKYSN